MMNVVVREQNLDHFEEPRSTSPSTGSWSESRAYVENSLDDFIVEYARSLFGAHSKNSFEIQANYPTEISTDGWKLFDALNEDLGSPKFAPNLFSSLSIHVYKLYNYVKCSINEDIVEDKYKDSFKKILGDTLVFSKMWSGDMPLPVVNVAEDGEILLEWKKSNKHLIVGFEGDGVFGYTMLIDDKFVPGKEDGSLNLNRLPFDLIEYINSM